MVLPIVSNKYTKIHIYEQSLFSLLDGFQMYANLNGINNGKLYDFSKKETPILVLEHLVYDVPFEKFDRRYHSLPRATYFILCKDFLYSTNGISSLDKLAMTNNLLLTSIIEFISNGNVDGGFDTFNAINKLASFLKEW